LNFSSVYENSIDAVSDRDYIVETLHNISLTMVHLSRFSEEIIFWSSSEANFVTLSDSFSTGSSIMPQKKNPDMAERSEEHTSELQSRFDLVCRLLLEN